MNFINTDEKEVRKLVNAKMDQEAKKHYSKVKRQTKKIGTYKPEYESAMKILAEALRDYDCAKEQFEEGGGVYMVEYTNKAGATNYVSEPLPGAKSVITPYRG